MPRHAILTSRRACIVGLASCFWPVTAMAQAPPRAPFVIAGHAVPGGQRMHVDLPVAASASDPATTVPVTVFHGAHPGQVLAITTGVHGYEFAPILAAQALLDRIDPSTLRGTVVLVRLAHVEAFEQRVPYVNPYDRKNLNRTFPGRADGTQTERIAWASAPRSWHAATCTSKSTAATAPSGSRRSRASMAASWPQVRTCQRASMTLRRINSG